MGSAEALCPEDHRERLRSGKGFEGPERVVQAGPHDVPLPDPDADRLCDLRPDVLDALEPEDSTETHSACQSRNYDERQL